MEQEPKDVDFSEEAIAARRKEGARPQATVVKGFISRPGDENGSDFVIPETTLNDFFPLKAIVLDDQGGNGHYATLLNFGGQWNQGYQAIIPTKQSTPKP